MTTQGRTPTRFQMWSYVLAGTVWLSMGAIYLDFMRTSGGWVFITFGLVFLGMSVYTGWRIAQAHR